MSSCFILSPARVTGMYGHAQLCSVFKGSVWLLSGEKPCCAAGEVERKRLARSYSEELGSIPSIYLCVGLQPSATRSRGSGALFWLSTGTAHIVNVLDKYANTPRHIK